MVVAIAAGIAFLQPLFTGADLAVQKVVPLDSFGEQQLLEFAMLAELHASHPIAKAIVVEGREMGLKPDSASVTRHEDLPGRGVWAQVAGQAGSNCKQSA